MTNKRRSGAQLVRKRGATPAQVAASLRKRGAVFATVLADHDDPPLVVWSRRALHDVAKDAFADAQRCLTTVAVQDGRNTVAPIVSPESEFVTDAATDVQPLRAISRRHDARRPLLSVAERDRTAAD